MAKKAINKRLQIWAKGFEADVTMEENRIRPYLNKIKKTFGENIKVQISEVKED